MKELMRSLGKKAREAARFLATAPTEAKNKALGESARLMREEADALLEANKKDPRKMKKSGFAARLEAMQKQQEELMKQRQNQNRK